MMTFRARSKFIVKEAAAFFLAASWSYSNGRKWAYTFSCTVCEAALRELGESHRDRAARAVYKQDDLALDHLDRFRDLLQSMSTRPLPSVCDTCRLGDDQSCPIAHTLILDACKQYKPRPQWQTAVRDVASTIPALWATKIVH